MNPQLAYKKGFKVALGSFMVAGMLAILLLASLSTTWGVAYGATAGPVPPSTTTGTNSAPSSTQSTGVQGSNQSPGTPASIVGDANQAPVGDVNQAPVADVNQAPVGVVPGLPHTGTQSPASDDTWKYGVLALLALNMTVAAFVMVRNRKSAKQR